MLERKCGHIVTIASVLGLVAADKIADYVATKFGQVGLDESIKAQFYLLGKDDPFARKGEFNVFQGWGNLTIISIGPF